MLNKEEVFLFDEFKTYLEEIDFNHPGSRKDIPSRLKRINVDFISKISFGNDIDFMQILDESFDSEKYEFKTSIFDLVDVMSSYVNQEAERLKKSDAKAYNDFSSRRSAFRHYVDFLSEIPISIDSSDDSPEKVSVKPAKLKVPKLADGNFYFTQDDLITVFARRIYTQDRVTGDKTYLPLGLIRSILKRGELFDWAKKEAGKIKFNVDLGEHRIIDIDRMLIDTASGKAFIQLKGDSEEKELRNPGVNNGEKSEMRVYQLSDCQIDHEKEIDDILKDLSGKLPALDKLTELLKKKRITTGNRHDVYRTLKNNDELKQILSDRFKKDLREEIKKISGYSHLQLSDANWNLSVKKRLNKN